MPLSGPTDLVPMLLQVHCINITSIKNIQSNLVSCWIEIEFSRLLRSWRSFCLVYLLDLSLLRMLQTGVMLVNTDASKCGEAYFARSTKVPDNHDHGWQRHRQLEANYGRNCMSSFVHVCVLASLMTPDVLGSPNTVRKSNIFEIRADVVLQVTGIHCPGWRRHRLQVSLGGHTCMTKGRKDWKKSTICARIFLTFIRTSMHAVLWTSFSSSRARVLG